MALVQRRVFTLKDVKQENPQTKTFTLVPQDGLPISFIPGQWITLGIFTDDGLSFKESRPYSIASSPTEDSSLQLTFNIVGSFTGKLNHSQSGDKFGVMGPFGHFQFNEAQIKHAVFIAGGIGVTPMMGMARYALAKKLATPITFFYSNKSLESAAFFDELSNMQNPNMKMVFTFTRPEEAPVGWTGETGRVSESMIRKHVPDFADCTFFVCGPVKMTQDMAAMLKTTLNIPSERIKVEGWG